MEDIRPDPTIAVLRYVEGEIQNLNEKIVTDRSHSLELREAESKRIDANRAGDLRAIEIKAAQDQILISDLSKRISSLESAQSQSVGKTGVINPIFVWFGLLIIALITAIITIMKK